jgi:hypothetical protein
VGVEERGVVRDVGTRSMLPEVRGGINPGAAPVCTCTASFCKRYSQWWSERRTSQVQPIMGTPEEVWYRRGRSHVELIIKLVIKNYLHPTPCALQVEL